MVEGNVVNTARRAPMVFVLDATGSMLYPETGKSRMDLLNMVLESFIVELILDAKARAALEVAFVVFTDEILLTTDFMSLDEIAIDKFHTGHRFYQNCVSVVDREGVHKKSKKAYCAHVPVFEVATDDNGTKIGAAVLKGLGMLENYVKKRSASNSSGCYAPFLVMVTDGHPQSSKGAGYEDELQNKAVAAVRSHCQTDGNANNLIIPFVIGVGDDNIGTETLKQYSGGFVDGFFHVEDAVGEALMRSVSGLICKSIKKSMSLNALGMKAEMKKNLDEFEQEKRDILEKKKKGLYPI